MWIRGCKRQMNRLKVKINKQINRKRSSGGELERTEGASALGFCCPLMPSKCLQQRVSLGKLSGFESTYILFVSACFWAGWLWRADKSLWETSSPTVCFSIKVKRWTRTIVTAHRGAAQLFKWIPALFYSVRALTSKTGSRKVAFRAVVTQQRYYTCASCRSDDIIFLAHLSTVAVIQFSAVLMLIILHTYWNRWPRIDWQCWTVYEAITAVWMQQRHIPAESFSFSPFAQCSSLKYVLPFCVVKKDGSHHICVILHKFFNVSFLVTTVNIQYVVTAHLWASSLYVATLASRVTMCTSEKYFS